MKILTPCRRKSGGPTGSKRYARPVYRLAAVDVTRENAHAPLMYLVAAKEAQSRIASHILRTPVLRARALDEVAGAEVWLKVETFQPTGSFKVRPAFNGILSQLDRARASGVLTTSSGNFAQAVAHAARVLGVRATIVMTDDTAPMKVERTRALGAEVVFCGLSFESRFETLERLRKERGSLILHPFDSPETIAGDGTLALELLERFPRNFALITPASGGGLAAGISAVIDEARPACEVYGVQPEAGGAIVRSLEKGERVNVGKVLSIADALVASVPGELTLDLIRLHSDGFFTVSEDEIRQAMRFLYEESKLVVEAGGAVGVAALLARKIRPRAPTVVCVLTGGNTRYPLD